MDSTTTHEWPEAVIASIRVIVMLFLGVASMGAWYLYLKLVTAIKNRFRLPSPGIRRTTLNVSVPIVWIFSPMGIWITMFTGLSAFGVTLLPQLLPNTCARSKALGFSYGWPCLREQMIAEWHASGMERDDTLVFWVVTGAFFILGVALLMIGIIYLEDKIAEDKIATRKREEMEMVCSRCRRSERLWDDLEKAGIAEQDMLV